MTETSERDVPLDSAARAELHDLLLDTREMSDFLDRLSAMAADAVHPDVSCGITLIRDGQPTTVANSDGRASQVDEIQYSNGDGPCLQSARTQEVVEVPDFAAEKRWEDFPIRAMAHGIQSSLSMPLAVERVGVGALNLYAAHAAVMGDAELRQARAFADEAGRALALAIRLSDQAQMTRDLQAALASRAVIDQAIGIIMAQNRCSSETAFSILRNASHHRNIKLREVASGLVAAIAQGDRSRPSKFS